MSTHTPNPPEIAEFIRAGVEGDVTSIAIIGSYLIADRVREGSDIDLIVAVKDLGSTSLQFGEIFYKDIDIKDSMGERKELNTILGDTTLDITVIDRFNEPNNPLTDSYENAIGSCLGSYSIHGPHLRDLFRLDDAIIQYADIRQSRLEIVTDKIASTKQKIAEQGREDLHILYELQRYVFIRECIGRGIFNRLSIKHPDESIPGFSELYAHELATCGLTVAVTRQS